MSHMLDRLASGVAAFVGTVTAWHKQGTVLEDGISYLEAIEHGGLDFEVSKAQNFVKVEREGWVQGEWLSAPGYVEATNSFSVVRSDRTGSDSIIGTVGRVWEPLQNRHAFGVLETMVDNGTIKIETAGCLRGGGQVWMLVQFNKNKILAEAQEWLARHPDVDTEAALATLHELVEEVAPFALVTNDHTGGAMARIFETWVRVVCANTMEAAERGQKGLSLAVSHTSNVTENYKVGAAKIFTSMARRYAEFAGTRDLLKKTILPSDIGYSTSPFRQHVLDVAVPVHQLEEKIRRREGTGHTVAALDRAHDKRGEITRLWTQGMGHTGDYSAWEAWQGVVQYYDHDSELKSADSSRIASLYNGSLGKIKSRIGSSLVGYAQEAGASELPF
mgnify:FL=1